MTRDSEETEDASRLSKRKLWRHVGYMMGWAISIVLVAFDTVPKIQFHIQ